MLKRVKGDLLRIAEAGDFDIIVHGCNCQNTMGSGIAKQIKDKYPTAFEADTKFYEYMYMNDNQYGKLGTYTSAFVGVFKDDIQPFFIVNAYTQFNYLPRGADHFQYLAFEMILQKLLFNFGTERIGFPYIGMGLAGGDKEKILSQLERFAKNVTAKGGSVTLVEYEG